MAVASAPIFNEVYEFLVSSPTPQQILDFRPSEATQERLLMLRDASQEGELTDQQQAELDEFVQLEHFVRMLKIKAKQKIMTP